MALKIAGISVVDDGYNIVNIKKSQIQSLGVGIPAPYGSGNIKAFGELRSNFSDVRLKENILPILDALAKVRTLHGVTYNANLLSEKFGYTSKKLVVGLLAHEVDLVQPEAVSLAPFDVTENYSTGEEVSKSGENYLTIQYEKLVPLLIESIKELSDRLEKLEGK
jgi:hypothetical protein